MAVRHGIGSGWRRSRRCRASDGAAKRSVGRTPAISLGRSSSLTAPMGDVDRLPGRAYFDHYVPPPSSSPGHPCAEDGDCGHKEFLFPGRPHSTERSGVVRTGVRCRKTVHPGVLFETHSSDHVATAAVCVPRRRKADTGNIPGDHPTPHRSAGCKYLASGKSRNTRHRRAGRHQCFGARIGKSGIHERAGRQGRNGHANDYRYHPHRTLASRNGHLVHDGWSSSHPPRHRSRDLPGASHSGTKSRLIQPPHRAPCCRNACARSNTQHHVRQPEGELHVRHS
jgi:hypothetical protein